MSKVISTLSMINNAWSDNSLSCFARGTLIATTSGLTPIEQLNVGDLVQTKNNGNKAIKWVGDASVSGQVEAKPILIKEGMLGNIRDLLVSPESMMLLRGCSYEDIGDTAETFIVAAKHLVNGSTIIYSPCDIIEYHYILFDGREVIFCEGAEFEMPKQSSQNINAEINRYSSRV